MAEIVKAETLPLLRLLTVQEVARLFGSRQEWVRRKLIGGGIVRASKVGGRFFVQADEVERVLSANQVREDAR